MGVLGPDKRRAEAGLRKVVVQDPLVDVGATDDGTAVLQDPRRAEALLDETELVCERHLLATRV